MKAIGYFRTVWRYCICNLQPPAMIQTAIRGMVDYLDGNEVEQDHVIACEIVNKDNVKDYPSF